MARSITAKAGAGSYSESSLGLATVITIAVIVSILGAYYQTVWSMIMTWYRSETYTHGFLIIPFAIYMIWGRRHELMSIHHQSNLSAVFFLGLFGFLWLIAEMAGIQVLTQYMLVAMIPATVAALLGYRALLALAFPLGYLFFAVPFGEVLIPPLIEFTADFTIRALQLSGIPVYREGSFFSIPSGNWSVVEACSGLRYLIASVTLGTLYAYLTYRSLSRRLIFIGFSIAIPILANGIRAYLIVMTGHLSDMQLAVGVDHLIYGWVFFGLVMLLLFWVGSFWREDDTPAIKEQNSRSIGGSSETTSIRKTVLTACVVLIVAWIWPIYAAYLEKSTTQAINPDTSIVISNPAWNIHANTVSDWEPIYIGTPLKHRQNYAQKSDQPVSLYVTLYFNQQQGQELINAGNIMVPEIDPHWRSVGKTGRTVDIGSGQIMVTQNHLQSASTQLLVWRWYWLGDSETTSPYVAKAILARNKLLNEGDSAAEIIVATPFDTDMDKAAQELRQFIMDMKPIILEELGNATIN